MTTESLFSWKLHHKTLYQGVGTTKLKPEILIVSINSVYFDARIEGRSSTFLFECVPLTNI
jgi:hypothetical protein